MTSVVGRIIGVAGSTIRGRPYSVGTIASKVDNCRYARSKSLIYSCV